MPPIMAESGLKRITRADTTIWKTIIKNESILLSVTAEIVPSADPIDSANAGKTACNPLYKTEVSTQSSTKTGNE
jgi:hypothetical protein